jgi:hypothetical protein
MNAIQSPVRAVPAAGAADVVSGARPPHATIPARRAGRRVSTFWWGVWALLAALCVAVVGPAYVNHDAAWYLHMARRMLDGATLYRDVVDTNPPLIVLLTVPPVWLAGTVAAPAVFKAYVFCLALLSLAVSAAVIRRTWFDAADMSRQLFISALVFVSLPFVRTDFGQREHLLILMVLPYVLMAVARATADVPVRTGLAVALGIAAGLGFAMKPHYLLGWIAAETALLTLAPRGRSWRRPEAIAAAAAIAGYALSVVLFVPQ